MTVWECPRAVAIPGKISDGDSWQMSLDAGWRVTGVLVKIRLAGVDAPGANDPVAKVQAKAFVSDLLLPIGLAPVVCRVVSHLSDQYGRWVSDVYLPDGRSIATLLVASGNAVLWDGHGPHPVGGGA